MNQEVKINNLHKEAKAFCRNANLDSSIWFFNVNLTDIDSEFLFVALLLRVIMLMVQSQLCIILFSTLMYSELGNHYKY